MNDQALEAPRVWYSERTSAKSGARESWGRAHSTFDSGLSRPEGSCAATATQVHMPVGAPVIVAATSPRHSGAPGHVKVGKRKLKPAGSSTAGSSQIPEIGTGFRVTYTL